jgi:hypothetical protein
LAGCPARRSPRCRADVLARTDRLASGRSGKVGRNIGRGRSAKVTLSRVTSRLWGARDASPKTFCISKCVILLHQNVCWLIAQQTRCGCSDAQVADSSWANFFRYGSPARREKLITSELSRKTKDPEVTLYLAFVHDERNAHGARTAKVIHSQGLEDILTNQAVTRLANSIQSVLNAFDISPVESLEHSLSTRVQTMATEISGKQ